MTKGIGSMAGLDADNLEAYKLATEKAVVFDLTGHGLLGCSGKDSGQFLHNLCTNEVVKLPVGAASEAFLTTAQAKVVDHVWILNAGGQEPTFLVDVGPNEAPRIFNHLDRFLISEQLELSDLTGQTARHHVAGPLARRALSEATGSDVGRLKELEALEVFRGQSRLRIWRRNRLGVIGYDLLWDTSDSGVWSPVLGSLPMRSSECPAFDCLRIEAGLPRFGIDVSEANLPQEMGRIEQTISYTKGCYIGQETVARVRSFGHVNRTLRGLLVSEKNTLDPGVKLFHDGQEAGALTSCTISPRLGRTIALGYLRRGHDEPGTTLSLRPDSTEVNALVSSLPFVPFVEASA
jgi:folate-binding protein YgfZ